MIASPLRIDASPVARVDLAAIVANVRAEAAARPLVDLRADAFGHGTGTVAAALLEGTDAHLLVDDVDAGVDLPRHRLAMAADERPCEAGAVYGLGHGVPAMTLIGTVLGVKILRAGEGVSYGYLHRASADTRIALVTGGYAQGVVRSLGGQARVRIGPGLFPIVGRVAMDVCVVDIGDARVVRGAPAVFFGDPGRGDPAVAQWAAATGLTAEEIVTAVGVHVRREYSR